MGKLPRIYRTEKGQPIIIQPFEEDDHGWVSLADWKGRQNQIWFRTPAEIPDAVQELIERRRQQR
jgi:hypothetical protein